MQSAEFRTTDMQPARLAETLNDVAFATTTPFTPDGTAVDHDALRDNLDVITDAGGRLFLPCGNSGEYDALTDEERTEVVETHVDAVGDERTVIGGVAGSTKHATHLIEQYERVGVDGIMVMPPGDTYAHERGLVSYYERLAESTDLGLVPYKIGQKLTGAVVEEISTIENVVGIKFASGDVAEFARLIGTVPGDLVWVNGSAEQYAPAYGMEGAVGFTTGIGNFAPEASLVLMEAIAEHDWAEARRIRDKLAPFEVLRQEAGARNSLLGANNIPAVKYGMDLAGLHGGPVREPLTALSSEDQARANECYERIETVGR